MLEGKIEEEEGKRSPLIYVLAVFLILLLILMIVPFYGIKNDPEPKNLPKLEDVFNGVEAEKVEHKVNSYEDFANFVDADNDAVRNLAVKIVTGSCENANKVCYAKALFYFVRDNINYVSDPYRFEYGEMPIDVLNTKGGDCDGFAVLLASLEKAVGFRVRFVFTEQHVFVQVYLPETLRAYKAEGNWINLDATCKECGFGELSYRFLKEEKIYLDV